jgi:integrase
MFTTNNKLNTELKEKMLNKYSENTILGYENAVCQFLKYCDSHGYPKTIPFSVEIIQDYIYDNGSYYKPSNLRHFISALTAVQRRAGITLEENTAKHESVQEAYDTVAKKNNHQVKKAKALIYVELLKGLSEYTWTGSQSELRDKAMILLGFYGAMRRSEILELKYEDLEFSPRKGYVIYIRFSKTDQKSKGMYKAIPINPVHPELCPVTALNGLLGMRGKKKGYLFTSIFKSGKMSADKMTGKGFDYIFGKYYPGYSSHSLRAGFVTTAFQNGAAVNSIMNQTGHKDSTTTFAYNRAQSIWIDNAVDHLF